MDLGVVSRAGNRMISQLKKRFGPDGVHLFDRVTGINLLIDEVKVPIGMWAKAPRHVSIALTNACDLHCPHCFTPKNMRELDVNRLIPWLGELDSNGCLGIGFGGGEPTLFEDLPRVCRHAAKNTGLAVTLTTNTQHLHDRLASDLKGNIHFMRVSMDGIGATYEVLRGRPFSSLLRCLGIVRELAPFGINFLVNAQTLPDLDAAVELAGEAGASEFLLLPEQPVSGRGGIDNRTSRSLRNWVNSYRGTIPLCVSEASADGLPTCNPLKQDTGLRAYAHIDASGVLKRSSFDEDGVIIDGGEVMQALKALELSTGEKL